MPFKETEKSFELRPYGIFQTSLISGSLCIIGIVLIILGLYEKNQAVMGYTYFIVLGGLFLGGGIIYLIVRLWRYFSGSLNLITIDIEGIRVYNRKTGLQKSLTWDQKPRQSVDEDDETGYPLSIIFSTDNEEETIQINLDDYSNVFLRNYKLVEKTKSAVASFRAKYRKSIN